MWRVPGLLGSARFLISPACWPELEKDFVGKWAVKRQSRGKDRAHWMDASAENQEAYMLLQLEHGTWVLEGLPALIHPL